MQESKADLSRNELPRFGVIHILGLTAVTALAFVPYRLHALLYLQPSPDAASQEGTALATAYFAMGGLTEGIFLFVAVAAIYWKCRGYTFLLEPGHWLAFRNAYLAIASIPTWVAISSSPEVTIRWHLWLSTPYLLGNFAFFVYFLWLALRRFYPLQWRWALAVISLTPAVQWGLSVSISWLTSRGLGFLVLLYAMAAAGQAFMLVYTMQRDLKQGRSQHWSHWFSAFALLTQFALATAVYGYTCFTVLASRGS